MIKLTNRICTPSLLILIIINLSSSQLHAKVIDETSIHYMKPIISSIHKYADQLYCIEKYTKDPAYLALRTTQEKITFLQKEFLIHKHDIIKTTALKQILIRFALYIPILIYCFGGGTTMLIMVGDKLPLLAIVIIILVMVIFLAIVIHIIRMDNYLITQFIQYASIHSNPSSLFDFKQRLELKFLATIVQGLDPDSIAFVIKKLKAMWELPEENKQQIAMLTKFLDQVAPYPKKPLTYDIHAFREKIKHYPEKIRKQAEIIYFYIYIALSYNIDQKQKIVISLIGLPGFGKTRLARIIAKSLGLCYAAIDLSGENKHLFGEKNVSAGRLAEALSTAKQIKDKSGYIALICDDADRIMKQKGSNITMFLSFFDPTNLSWPNPYYDNASLSSPDVIFLVGNFSLKDSALSDRMSQAIIFDQPFSPQAKLAIALESIQEKLDSNFYQDLLGCTIDEKVLRQKIKAILQDEKNTYMTAREIQNTTISLLTNTAKTAYEKQHNIQNQTQPTSPQPTSLTNNLHPANPS